MTGEDSRRVAVVAVHGVGDHEPHASARQVADLLRSRPPSPPPLYGEFREEHLRLPIQSLPGQPSSPAGDSHDFMLRQLKDHEVAANAVYETIRLQSRRREVAEGHGPEREREVDVYEIYWADLSRLGEGVWQVFGELFQLLFHLPSLGLHTIASWHLRKARSWRLFWNTHRFAVALLNRSIPILNLVLMMIGTFFLSADVLSGPWLRTALVTAVLGSVLALAFLWARRRESLGYGGWLFLPMLALAAAMAAWRLPSPWSRRVLVSLLLAAVALLLLYLLGIYEERRPRATRTAWILAAIAAVLWLAAAPRAFAAIEGSDRVRYLALFSAEVVYSVLYAVWWLFVLAHFVAIPAGALAWRGLEDAKERAAARQMVETARITLALPAALLALLGYALWAVFVAAAEKTLGSLAYQPHILVWLGRGQPQTGPPDASALRFARTLVTATGELAVIASAVALVLALVLAVWATLPSILAEARVPEGRQEAERLGRWLDRGFQALGAAGRIVVLVVWVILPAGLLLRALGSDTNSLYSFAAAIGSSVGLSSVGLLLLTGRIEWLSKRIRPTLDVLLDVDNHLRRYPQRHNPRAQIAARSAALLRYLGDRPGESGYDAVVIVAHSQGSVIVADLLRYLKRVDLPAFEALARKPLHLFTMGCPLRQLYSVRFPGLYAWARHDDPGPWSAPSRIPDGQRPDPLELGLSRWVNAYRSGDYIGRNHWRPDGRHDAYCDTGCVSEDAGKTRREFCIGAGAHTRYWDETATAIATELDRLVATA
jgi:hypothetical protein